MVRDSDAAASWAPSDVAVVPILGSVTVWPASSMSASLEPFPQVVLVDEGSPLLPGKAAERHEVIVLRNVLPDPARIDAQELASLVDAEVLLGYRPYVDGTQLRALALVDHDCLLLPCGGFDQPPKRRLDVTSRVCFSYGGWPHVVGRDGLIRRAYGCSGEHGATPRSLGKGGRQASAC